MPKAALLLGVNAAVIGFSLNKRKASSKLDSHYFCGHGSRQMQEVSFPPRKWMRLNPGAVTVFSLMSHKGLNLDHNLFKFACVTQ